MYEVGKFWDNCKSQEQDAIIKEALEIGELLDIGPDNNSEDFELIVDVITAQRFICWKEQICPD